MIIAVDTRNLNSTQTIYTDFVYECLKRVTTAHPEDHFIFISDKPLGHAFIFSENITTVVTGPKATLPFLWQFWYNYKITAVIKKYKADVFVATYGICSLRSQIPQCLLLQDISFLSFPQFIAKSNLRFYKKFIPQFLSKAKSIITLSEFSKQVIIEQYKTDDKKIGLTYHGTSEMYTSIGWEEKEMIKEKYSDGKEYFLYAGDIHPRKNIIALLKAFTLFKKRQKSNMQLLIISQTPGQDDSFLKSLKTYKYREEVKIMTNLSKELMVKITAAAYAFIQPSLFEDFPVSVIEAMKCAVPVVISNIQVMKEMAGDAALYADPNNFEDIADKMMLLFKDENKRNELITKGNLQAQLFSWDRTAGLLWQSILKATQS